MVCDCVVFDKFKKIYLCICVYMCIYVFMYICIYVYIGKKYYYESDVFRNY